MSYQLHLGDALTLLPTFEAQSIDAIITDLPYGTTACSWDEVIPFAPMWEQVRRLLKPRGAFVTTASQPFTSKLVMSNPKWFKYAWVWDKVQPVNYLNAKHQPLRVCEDIVVFSDGQSTYVPQMLRGQKYSVSNQRQDAAVVQYGQHKRTNRINVGEWRYPKNMLSISQGRSPNSIPLHPTQKPVALYSYLIRTYTNPGDTVLDFVMGSGTTGVAAIKEGRNFVGVELDKGYFKVAQKRISEAAMQLPLLDVA